jgi:hypothetical protein
VGRLDVGTPRLRSATDQRSLGSVQSRETRILRYRVSLQALRPDAVLIACDIEVYGTGESERVIGRLRKEANETIQTKVYIASKCITGLRLRSQITRTYIDSKSTCPAPSELLRLHARRLSDV